MTERSARKIVRQTGSIETDATRRAWIKLQTAVLGGGLQGLFRIGLT